MKILLIYPGLVEGFRSYFLGRDWVNHGIGFISAVLKKENHEISCLDLRKLSGWAEVEKKINAIDFDLALISVATVDFDPARKIAKIIKRKNPALRVMVGGPHPTLMTSQTEEVKEFDYIFTREAEITLPVILRRYPDIARVTQGEMPPDLDALPFADRSFSKHGETPWFSGLQKPYFSLIGSRGCLYKCTFCQPAERAVFGDRVRKRSANNILDELDLLTREYGMKSFMIHDDCFTQYLSWVEEFCENKNKRGMRQLFACQTRADIVCKHPDIIQKLKNAGLRWVLIGFESGSDRILQFIEKGTTVEQNIRAARICKELGIKIFANYMFGLPTETKEEMMQTAQMIRAIRPDMYSPAVFTPAPGSGLYFYCRDRDLILIKSSSGYRRDADSGAKIKCVDYNFVDKMILESVSASLIRYLLRKIKIGIKLLKYGKRNI